MRIRTKNPQDGPPSCRPRSPLKIAPSALAAIIKPMITPKKHPTLRRNPPRRSERPGGGHGSSSGHQGGRGGREGRRGEKGGAALRGAAATRPEGGRAEGTRVMRSSVSIPPSPPSAKRPPFVAR